MADGGAGDGVHRVFEDFAGEAPAVADVGLLGDPVEDAVSVEALHPAFGLGAEAAFAVPDDGDGAGGPFDEGEEGDLGGEEEEVERVAGEHE